MLNVPNFLTLLRIMAIPVFLILLEDLRYRDALLVFVAAGITDALDGTIARLTHTKTTLGAYLDPAADKLLLLSAFIALGFMHIVPRWLVVVVLMRDVIIVAGYILLFMMTQRTMEVRPNLAGKVGTFLQLLSVFVVLVSQVRAEPLREHLQTTIFVAAGVTTALAGFQYVHRGLKWLQTGGAT